MISEHQYEQVASPFQRNNNAYWTLQTRKQLGNKTKPSTNGVQDDFQVNHKKTIEDLYSTPNKQLKKQRPSNNITSDQLRPTVQGFSTYFSPIARAADTSLKISPIDPRNTGGSFKTSTPSKSDNASTPLSSLADDLRHKLHIHEIGGSDCGGGNGSNVSSPLSSGRSTPRLEPQSGRTTNDPNNLSQTCSDRMGTPKTTLMDFKKLLLTKAGKSSIVAAKPSAVEQLRLARESAAAKATLAAAHNNSMNILDLSGSPKTFANRRMLRQGNFGSPSKSLGQSVSKHMSPRSAWKFNNYRTDVMSTAIPEVNSEEDTSPNNSKDRHTGISPQRVIRSAVQSIDLHNEPKVVEESISLKDNIFLQAEENNFTKGEVVVATAAAATKSLSRAQLSQARSQFLATATPTNAQPQILRSAQFKNGHYTGISPTRHIADASAKFISNTEAIVETNAEGTQAPSLETAL